MQSPAETMDPSTSKADYSAKEKLVRSATAVFRPIENLFSSKLHSICYTNAHLYMQTQLDKKSNNTGPKHSDIIAGKLPPGRQTWSGLQPHCFDLMIRNLLDGAGNPKIATEVLSQSDIFTDFDTCARLFELAGAFISPGDEELRAITNLGYVDEDGSSKYRLAIYIEAVGKRILIKNVKPRLPPTEPQTISQKPGAQQGRTASNPFSDHRDGGTITYMVLSGLRLTTELLWPNDEDYRVCDPDYMAFQSWLCGSVPRPSHALPALERLSKRLGVEYPSQHHNPDEARSKWTKVLNQWDFRHRQQLLGFKTLLYEIFAAVRAISSAERCRVENEYDGDAGGELQMDWVSLGLDEWIRGQRIAREAEIHTQCDKLQLVWRRSSGVKREPGCRPDQGEELDEKDKRDGVILRWGDEETRSLPDMLTTNLKVLLGEDLRKVSRDMNDFTYQFSAWQRRNSRSGGGKAHHC